ncbi:hypothetical protein DR085_00520 [Mycoplasma flocculare]|uniref:hypothetical protein n=1 Tax=Mesomycoplasma flocculare TaxID=2128 RepID=UPI00136C0B38|nr:hypothetical protein [Mesomycoplasma flocculare]MXR13366.1 hypothetical protein [Mesomycoplasma flocculare]
MKFLIINIIEVIKGIRAKPIEYHLIFNPDCLNVSSSRSFQAKEIRKTNEKRNKKIKINDNAFIVILIEKGIFVLVFHKRRLIKPLSNNLDMII